MWAILAHSVINFPLPDRQTQFTFFFFFIHDVMGTLRSQPEAVMEHLVRGGAALQAQVEAMQLWDQVGLSLAPPLPHLI